MLSGAISLCCWLPKYIFYIWLSKVNFLNLQRQQAPLFRVGVRPSLGMHNPGKCCRQQSLPYSQRLKLEVCFKIRQTTPSDLRRLRHPASSTDRFSKQMNYSFIQNYVLDILFSIVVNVRRRMFLHYAHYYDTKCVVSGFVLKL